MNGDMNLNLNKVKKSSLQKEITERIIRSKNNLFLINPNGILFGDNAKLEVSGSFVGTTANAIRFGNQGFFRASASEVPLLTVNPSALFYQSANSPIENKSSVVNTSANLRG